MQQAAKVSDCEPPAPFFGQVRVVFNRPLARDTFLLRLDAPPAAREAVPGQFFMLREPGTTDPLLGRAFALWDAVPEHTNRLRYVELGYLVVGKMTRAMRRLRRGDLVEIWGPLGNGFPAEEVNHLVMVAGGIGQTPFPALAKEYLGLVRYGSKPRKARAGRVTLCYGTRTASLLAGLEVFGSLGVRVLVSTDDGTAGRPGRVTELLQQVLGEEQDSDGTLVVCCGPEPMMVHAAQVARQYQVRCLLSLETPMACGIGVCCSCVVPVKGPKESGWDYCRSCLHGPVFDAQDLELDRLLSPGKS